MMLFRRKAKKKMKLNELPIFVKSGAIAVALLAAMAGGYAYRGHSPAETAPTPTPAPEVPAVVAAPEPSSASGLPDFAGIVAGQGPAVVNISASGKVKTGLSGFQGMPQLDPDNPFYDFFRHFQTPEPEDEEPVQALGSGFIVSPDGVILTNAHVVDDADEVTVKLTDRREFKAKVVGLDKPSDVAVLKIDAKNLPTVRIGDPQRVRVGEWVLAIGSPFGFENSVTAGIVSAKSRALPDESYVPFLQTDVAVNPGNSGGPLFDMQGEVIGINSQIYTRSGGYQGLSFAIPIDVAMKVERQLLDYGKVSRGRLGIMIQEVDQRLADSFGLNKPAGALVSGVENGSPAEQAGIEPGDVILKFNGQDIERSEQLPPLVADIPPGKSVKVKVWHDRKAEELSVRVGEVKAVSAGKRQETQSKGKLGLAVRPLSGDEQKQADVSGGLLVQDVSDGPAARAGIQPGDVILAVNGSKVATVEQLRALVDSNEKHLALLILRGDSRMYVPIRLG